MMQNAVLKRIRLLRTQLSYMYDYVMVCKQKDELVKVLGNRMYFMTGTEMLSLSDFQEVKVHDWNDIQIKNNTLLPWLESVVGALHKHITRDCFVRMLIDLHVQACQGRGHICPCGKDPVVYPFQFDIATICRRCNVVY